MSSPATYPALTCPVCDRPGNQTDRCPNCDAGLEDLRLLSGLSPLDVTATAGPAERSGSPVIWTAVVGALGLAIGFGLPRAPLPSPAPSAQPVMTNVPRIQPAPAPLQVEGFRYRVRPGDSLWRIAERLYGDGNLYPLLRAEPAGRMLQPGDVIVAPNRP